MEEKKKIILVSKKDLKITWFSGGGGGGGQHKNRHNNCCRINHPESGVTTQATKQRSAHQNQKEAFEALTKHPDFRLWLARRIKEVRDGETIEQEIIRTLKPEHVKVEVLRDGQWIEIDSKELM